MGTTGPLLDGDPVRIGRYRLVGRLGAGGMGRVYLARSPGGRAVAVKVVHAEHAEEPEFRRRFAREVAAARRVSGAFTASVIDADPEGSDGSPPWLATVYVPGPSLAEAVAAHGPWPAQSVLALGAGLVEGLDSIHAAGLVHRDLKPSNVLLAPDGPRVIDFGISVETGASALTRTGAVVGTPGYMSPEQLTGGTVGPASDVFSLASVLVFAATGTGPFGTGHGHALSFRVVYESPELAGLPPELRAVVEPCLTKDPERRPSVASLLEQLGEAAHPGEAAPLGAGSAWLPEPVARAVDAPTANASRGVPEGAPGGATAGAVPDGAAWEETRRDTPHDVPTATATAMATATAPRPSDDPPSDAPTPTATRARRAGVPRRRALTGLLTLAGGAATAGLAGWYLVGRDGDENGGGTRDSSGSRSEPGTKLWEFTAAEPISRELVAGPGAVYAAAENGFLHAIATGTDTGAGTGTDTAEELWRFDSEGEISFAISGAAQRGVSGGAYANDLVYVGGVSLHAVAAATGSEVWRYPTDNDSISWFAATPAAGDGALYAVDQETGLLHALEAVSGERRWIFHTNGTVDHGPAVAGGTVCVGTSGLLYGVDVYTGGEKWRYEVDGGVSGVPEAVDRTVYVPGGEGLYALDAVTGAERWRAAPLDGGSPFRSPLVAGDAVFCTHGDGRLYAIDATTGDRRWQIDLGTDDALPGEDVSTNLAAVGDAVCVAVRGRVLAVDVATGGELWSSAELFPAGPGSSLVAPLRPESGGAVVFVAAGQTVHAIRA
ncbi:outer membrane protein assembly factor BamB family protein [Streptomyces sp. 4N509B]|uniref:outer membrane protein assembly factor BamB family protein n=1 Tax=Streptomyces sp. 4N509B TaxID=3457413 RepID=UPI003FD5D585